MSDGKLYLGHRRYSSWSLRGWLAVRLAGLDVEEVVIRFVRPGPTPAIRDVSPNGLVPYLEHRGARVWESLAICDYCAEIAPALWPADRIARAHARSIAAEMHAGFRELRQAMWMNLCRDFAGRGRTPGALADIARIESLWAETRGRFGAGGPYLFGAEFTAADVMYAPRGGALPELETGTTTGNARILRCRACPSAGRGVVQPPPPPNPRIGASPITSRKALPRCAWERASSDVGPISAQRPA